MKFWGPAGAVDGGDRPVADTRQRTGALDDFAQDGVEVEACADAQPGGAQPGEALLQRCDPLLRSGRTLRHRSVSLFFASLDGARDEPRSVQKAPFAGEATRMPKQAMQMAGFVA